ncbi:MAG: hypothetical protein HY897_10315 [Deltaproteobacteria bacterium]|nr:hypothetical protein [Deltaproteobacteria bacterium]
MEFRIEETIAGPIEQVFGAMRDHLPDLVPFLPEVESIQVLEREEIGPGRHRFLNLWQGKPDAAPKAVRPFVSGNMLRWKDHAEWDEAARKVAWRLEPFHFGTLFECRGEDLFAEAPGGKTKMTIHGVLSIYPERIPGVPAFLARRLRPDVEKFIMNLVTPNLRGVAGGIARYLEHTKA